jgi:hypothetical protein
MTSSIDFDPTKRRISVSAKHFYAAWQFVSTEPTRYYLNGVYIEPHKDGGVLLIATDGHSMAVIRDASARFEGEKGWICTLPKQPFEAKMKRRDAGYLHFVGNTAYLTESILGPDAIDENYDPTNITVYHTAIAFAAPIDGTFPDWRRVIPKEEAGTAESYDINGKYLARFNKAFSVLREDNGSQPVKLFTPAGADNPVIIRCSDASDFFGVQMPMRGNDCPAYPYWLDIPKPEDKAETKPQPANDFKPVTAGPPPERRPVVGLKTAPVIKPDAA